jgi:hypothetical protein
MKYMPIDCIPDSFYILNHSVFRSGFDLKITTVNLLTDF